MKRWLFFFVSALIFLYAFLPKVHAADTPSVNAIGGEGDVAGLNCGVAKEGGGLDRCCSTQPRSLPDIPLSGLLSHLPFVGSIIDQYVKADENMEELQRESLTACISGEPTSDPTDPSCRCELSADAGAIPPIADLCQKYITDPDELRKCNDCTGPSKGGFYSGFGCVPLTLQGFVSNFLLSIGVNVAFVVALLCIIYSAFMLQTSQGNPERLKKAREYLTSCIVGLVLILFSVFLLRLIGVSILGIPGLI